MALKLSRCLIIGSFCDVMTGLSLEKKEGDLMWQSFSLWGTRRRSCAPFLCLFILALCGLLLDSNLCHAQIGFGGGIGGFSGGLGGGGGFGGGLGGGGGGFSGGGGGFGGGGASGSW